MENIKSKIEKKFDSVFLDLDSAIESESYTLVPVELHETIENLEVFVNFVSNLGCKLVTLNNSDEEIQIFVKFFPGKSSKKICLLNSFSFLIYIIFNLFGVLLSSYLLYGRQSKLFDLL